MTDDPTQYGFVPISDCEWRRGAVSIRYIRLSHFFAKRGDNCGAGTTVKDALMSLAGAMHEPTKEILGWINVKCCSNEDWPYWEAGE